MKKRIAAVAIAVMMSRGLGAGAAVPDVWDNFDGYSVGQTFVTPVNGWQASSNTVVVTNGQSQSGANSVILPGRVTLTNMVNGGGDKVIWTDCYVKPISGDMQSDLPVNTASLVAYFNPSGYVQVATSSSGWLTCSNDIWGGAIAPASSSFVRVSVYQNYSASNMALFVNGRLVVQDMHFAGSSATYNTFSVRNTSSNSWLDNVWIKTNYDASTLTNDVNGDGLADAGELAAYGYASRTLYVGSGYPLYGLQEAVNAWRARDTIYVQAGSYTGDLVISNAVTITGGVFSSTGSLKVSGGSSPALLGSMTWGTVEVASNAVSVFGASVGCSNLVIRSGANVTLQDVTCSNVLVEANASLTCLGAFVCSGNGSLQAGSQSVFSNTVSLAGSVSVASSANVVLTQGATVGSLLCTGSVTLASGVLAASSASLPGVITVATGGRVSVTGALDVPGSGHMEFTGATFQYSPLSVDMTGTFSISNNWGASGAVNVSSAANCSFGQALTNGALTVLVVDTNATSTFNGDIACSSLVVRAGSTVTVPSLTCSNLVVEPGAHFNCLGAFQCNGNAVCEQNSVASFSGTLAVTGSLGVEAGASVSLSQGGTAGILVNDGALTVASGKTFTTVTASVSGAVQVDWMGTFSVSGLLSVTGSGHLGFSNSRLVVPASNVDMTGTFTINNTWGLPTPGVALPFVDDFETYSPGTKLSDLSFLGWKTDYTNVVVQNSVANPAFGGSKALSIPRSTWASAQIESTAKKIWTDCYLRPNLGKAPFTPPTNTAGFVAYVDTNGWLEVATSNGWDVCSNLVGVTGQPDRMTTSSWTRVTVCEDLTNNTVAVFINGKLVRQLMKAPGVPLAAYSSFKVDNMDGQAYLDDVSIKETWPTTITADLDRDLVVDADEVDRIGSMTARNDWVSGTIFNMR